MRNLKRALSLVLAMVMLVGMMAINTNAASNFADADEIVNKEAVAITAGMGLFAGSDGKFNPKGNVTRAQMATIIVKMLRGSDFNADAFKGAANPFTDTAAFEGGWAEGYINACFQMGVVKGYGDGTFKPGNSVTTAEAVTMIINALKVDAGAGEWPLTVMAKATEMKLFGDLNPAPATNEALIRDQLAVITLEGLQYSENGNSGYKVNGLSGTFETYADALKAVMLSNGALQVSDINEVVGEDTLAGEVYSLGVVTGFVTGNKATGEDYTVVGEENFDIETGLDMIGHYVSVYYKTPAAGEYVEAYETYAIVEESTTVVVAEDIDSSKEYKTAFGRSYELSSEILILDGEYAETDTLGGAVPYTAGSSAPKGTYIIYENVVVAFLQPGTPTASQILAITDFDGEKTYTLAGVDNPIDETEITVYGGAKKDDYVTYTMAGGQYVLSPVDPVKGTASKYATNADGEIVITVSGVQYPLFSAETNNSGLEADPTALTLSTEQYTFYLTQDGKIVGWAAADGSSSTDVNVDDIVYALGWFALESKQGNYGEKVKKYYLQGVNTEGEEAHVLLAVEYDTDKDGVFGEDGEDEATLGTVPAEAYREGFYITSDPENKDAKKEGVKDVIRIGVKNERNAETGYLFYGLNRYGSSGDNTIAWPTSYANNHVCTTACAGETTHNNTIVSGASAHSGSGDDNTSNKTTRTFFGSDVKYVMIDGVLGEALKTDVGGSDFKWTLPSGEAMQHPMLYKLNDVGATEIVMIAIRKDPDDLSASTSTIFVADNTPTASSGEGDLYTVYTASTGTKQEVVLHGTDGESAPAVGFWSYKVEEDGSWTQMYKTTDDEKLGYTTGTLTELYFAGLFDGKTVSAIFANGKSVPFITGADASGAKIVDLRSEAQKSAEGISTITSVEQLGNLAESGKLVSVYIYNKGRTTTGCIYVKAIANNPTGVVYVTDPTTGAAITLDGKTTSVSVTSGELTAGFGRVETAEGQVSFAPVTDAKYRYGELVTSVSGSTVNTEVVATGAAKSLKVNDKTAIADTTSLGINSAEKLAAALEAGKKLTIACSAENGGNATLLVITGQGDPYLANGNQVYVQAPAAGSVTAKVISGVKVGQNYTFTVDEVVYPTGITQTKAENAAGYYTITKSAEGEITLTFVANVIPVDGDVFYIQGRVTAANVTVEAIAIDVAGVAVGASVYVQVPASLSPNKTGTTQSSSSFWTAQDNKFYRFLGIYNNTSSVGGHGVGGYKMSYHDTIYSISTTNGTITRRNAADHCSDASPKAPCSASPWTHSDACGGTVAKQSHEAPLTMKYDDGTVIINLSDATISGTTVAERLAEIKTLTDSGDYLVNFYTADGAKDSTTSTVDVIMVIPADPANVVLP